MQRVRESVLGIGVRSSINAKKGLVLQKSIPPCLPNEQFTSPLAADNKTPNRIVLKKSKVIFKDKLPSDNSAYTTVVSK